MPPIEDQRRASVTYARTSAFSELDHQLIGHPKSQRGAAAHKPTRLRTPQEARRLNRVWRSLRAAVSVRNVH
jgi:hypothetical protein